jgi:hypothetical protein
MKHTIIANDEIIIEHKCTKELTCSFRAELPVKGELKCPLCDKIVAIEE